jgi:hypothetical protein
MLKGKANPFNEALEKAETDLRDLEVKIRAMELERAKLRQTIAVLRAQLGIEGEQEGSSLTDSVLTVVTAAAPKPVTLRDVLKRLASMNGEEANGRSIATILCRLAKRNEIVSQSGPRGTTYSALDGKK